MSATVPLHPLYAFTVQTQTTLCLLSPVFTMNGTNELEMRHVGLHFMSGKCLLMKTEQDWLSVCHN